jgi:hypothetical protein
MPFIIMSRNTGVFVVVNELIRPLSCHNKTFFFVKPTPKEPTRSSKSQPFDRRNQVFSGNRYTHSTLVRVNDEYITIVHVCIGTTLKTEFVTTTHGWTARIQAEARVSSPVLVSLFFYVYNEGSGTIAFTSTKKSKGIIYGQTPEVCYVIHACTLEC